VETSRSSSAARTSGFIPFAASSGNDRYLREAVLAARYCALTLEQPTTNPSIAAQLL
jgi:hypothetical protein